MRPHKGHNAHKIESNWESQPTDDELLQEQNILLHYKSVSEALQQDRSVAAQVHVMSSPSIRTEIPDQYEHMYMMSL